MSAGGLSEAVSQVEADLAAFWATPTDETGSYKARAATMNFVALSSIEDVPRLRATVDALAEVRAGRVFLITLDGRLLPWDLRSDVRAVCHKEGDGVVCYDRIELAFGALGAGRVASVVRALTIEDVPTIVEIGSGAPPALTELVLPVASRIIVDSAHTHVTRIAKLAEVATVPFADRAWVRSFTWRELVARFFDEMPTALGAIRRIEVGRALGGACDPAMLLVGWFASRLGYQIDAADGARDGRGQRMEIAIVDGDVAGASPGDITAVRIFSAIDGQRITLACDRIAGSRAVRWSVSGAHTDVHEHPLGGRDENWVLAKAIDATEADAVYREAVLAAAELEKCFWGETAR